MEVPRDFPAIPQSILDRFPEAADWQRRLDEFWRTTNQAFQDAMGQVALQVNSQVVFTVDRFLINVNGVPTPMFAVDSQGVQIGSVLYVDRDERKMFLGVGNWDNADTPFYVDYEGFFSLGDSLVWDPDTDTLTITGTINATGGTIGGFDIGADYIRDSINSFGLASTVTAGNDVRFWAGDTFANRGSAPVRIRENGDTHVNSLTVAAIGLIGAGASGAIQVTGTFGPGVFSYVIDSSPTLSMSSNGSVAYGFGFVPTVAKSTFTGLTAYGGILRLNSATGTGTIDNAYGLYIDTVNIGTANWGLYVATTARNYMAGDLTVGSIGATTPGTGTFTTLGATGIISIITNNVAFSGRESGGSVRSLAKVNASNIIEIGDANNNLKLIGASGVADLTATGLAVTGVVNINGTAASTTAGHLQLGSGSQTTVGAAGAASALPANPTGYLLAYRGTSQIAIPYYAAA